MAAFLYFNCRAEKLIILTDTPMTPDKHLSHKVFFASQPSNLITSIILGQTLQVDPRNRLKNRDRKGANEDKTTTSSPKMF